MSLENTEAIDAIGLETATDTIVLSIIDSWDWEDERGHLVALQAKLNAYFGFVESGQIYESYPDAAGKNLRVDVIGRYPLPEVGSAFLGKASAVAAELRMSVSHRVHSGSN